jgi:ribosomal protein S27AE
MDDLNNLTNEQLGAMIQMLQKTLSSRDTEEKPKDERPNKFLEMPEFSMHKADTIIDQKLSVQPPTPRTRKFTPIKVRCRVCGKEEEINPSLLASEKERYKCNKCSAIAG